MFNDLLAAYQRHQQVDQQQLSILPHQHQVRTSPPTVIDQPDLFTAVLSPAEKEGEQ
jgi:hypothetical protein